MAEKQIKKDRVPKTVLTVSVWWKKSAKHKGKKIAKKIPAANGEIHKKKAAKAKGTCFFYGEDSHQKRKKSKAYMEHYQKQMSAATSGVFN